MNFGLSDEQQQLDDAERAWLTQHDPIARLRNSLDSEPITIDPAGISHLAESGLLALLTPDVGGEHADLAVLAEAHGWAASSLPVADLATAAWLLDLVDAPQAEPAVAGQALYGLARLPGESGGITTAVPMAPDLTGVVVVAESADADICTIIDQPEWIPMATLDLSRTWSRTRVGQQIRGGIGLPRGTVALIRDALAVHRALDALGAAARLLNMTVSYASQRQQFGVAIGSFQAVKHHCANMAVGVEAGRAALWAAALALDNAEPPARRHSAAAGAAYTKAAAADVAGTALQVHGGIGFTWEHDLHLLLRRVKVDEALDGTVAEHRAVLVDA
ncbi:acyl-CoA dehydrogenase [Mycobacterium sp.]|uniref:acyl-CoA dehydrogenase n=1 Tax=Mycobacterium sp. TaxID=1785 RepID=UPI00122A1CD5|nr:acyl-CoA dehydrogenase [Mycobacterium sp.]TAM64513.1 MAG: acyl-CoA dehydrogenase [Mycobacterium sp.]